MKGTGKFLENSWVLCTYVTGYKISFRNNNVNNTTPDRRQNLIQIHNTLTPIKKDTCR